HVRCARLAEMDDRVIRQVAGGRAFGLELVESRRSRCGFRRSTGDLRIGRNPAQTVVWRLDAPYVEGPERVAVASGAGRAIHADVAARGADVDGLAAAGTGGRGVDRGPGIGIVGDLDLERLGVRVLPPQDDPVDAGYLGQVDLDPLWVAELAGPAGGRIIVIDGVGRDTFALDGRRLGELVRREQHVRAGRRGGAGAA